MFYDESIYNQIFENITLSQNQTLLCMWLVVILSEDRWLDLLAPNIVYLSRIMMLETNVTDRI